MTPAADAAGARYQALVDAWSVLYSEAITTRDAGSVAAIERVGVQAYERARAYLETERRFIGETAGSIASDALRAASGDLGYADTIEMPEPASDALSATTAYLEREIVIQIERDIAQLQQAVRKTFLHASLTAQAGGYSVRRALIEHQIASSEGPAFYFRDRRQAKWPSRLFVRTIWRQALLSAFNEVTLSVLARAGITVAEVSHADGKAGVHGREVAFGPNSSLPAYGEIRNDIFHPNAEAVLVVPARYRRQA